VTLMSPLCTVAHHGRLWWADYSWGIITADPFADDPVLGFVPLPRPCVLEWREAHGVLDKFRYVGVSAGSLLHRQRCGVPNGHEQYENQQRQYRCSQIQHAAHG